ncbi:tRNA (adenosine(37)-N6)-dimethylallyltransferase MiaA [Acidithiobacillus sp. CV18-2]|uniref:tRNA dimethylallyltransferase n=1 Tax=Igneacidithiobacillus copahuensis TaxID=2724909 RepID=A0AAE2YRT8_9PROT|nr:tRNA (adenosine(37)-N6)-dimethylallyltransferase MiaA [Igneacidithiobacillus copahuensis]MBU2753874.1 tRNA (adenosine(37)-N6)-dimethylallyltransferase MiaA [Acidithiobacillus sp. CV18-3]MBU2757428.1 tRNA (adenosine(37)-N6)-dimethylallyltransferase MiaA [Acidithiobacillus sp. BN09-2]MBU2777300.1 tRNA (adenosine(37)-N6)-dimethylallyltransferase MiaA [Acidithiobacillus sp. CV18-2]MBU2796217.1 tRNA (adenosine(37)-N6)-dimethylallyltransferase MiaA [Acidithiobacillus sp. VAN18-2]MBU2798418.1 tRNA
MDPENTEISFLPTLFLQGPTASGKTALALRLADTFRVRLISVDSLAVYRHFDLGSAKPDPALQARYPHALIDIREPEEIYSAGDFARDARAEIAAARADGQIPLLVGGTGLYFRALERGIADLPPADPVLRQQLQREAERVGWPALHQRLAQQAPERAAAIHPHDAQRIQRALELLAEGKTMELWQGGLSGPLWKIVLQPARAELHERIAVRLQAMYAAGFREEAATLFGRYGDADYPACRAVGYRQLFAWLRGECSLPEAEQAALYATRQLAKRQATWFRAEEADWRLSSADGRQADAVVAEIRQRLQGMGE